MSAIKARFCVFALSLLMTVLACSLTVGANPVPIPSLADIYSAEGIALLFVTNFFINLLLFSLSLMAILKRWGRKAGNIDQNRFHFYTLTIMSGVFITMVGSVIDATLLYRSGYGMMWLYFDPMKWSVAAALIFLSIFIASTAIMRVHADLSLIPAGGMTVLNWLMWSFLFGYGIPVLCLPILVIVAILTAVLFRGLGAWHRDEFPDKKN